MPGLLTDWVTIGTSGATVDGRNIAADDLVKMAKNYDPAVYTAVVNVEHFYGNLGTVRELRTAPGVKGETALQARIRPNKYFLQQNSEDLRLFSSMEITRNFAQTGEPYLTGVATTDTPASLGTSELHFSAQNTAAAERAAAVELPVSVFHDCREERGFAEEFFNRFGELFAGKKKDEEMNADEVRNIVTEAVKPLNEQLAAVGKQLEKFSAGDGGTAGANAGGANAGGANAAQGIDLDAKFAALTGAVTKLTETVEKLAAENPGTKFAAGTGAANENKEQFV